jgi:hypothetical protein
MGLGGPGIDIPKVWRGSLGHGLLEGQKRCQGRCTGKATQKGSAIKGHWQSPVPDVFDY